MNDLSATLQELFLRELQKLRVEIQSFPDEGSLWKITGDVKNSAGNLCLHLCGNLQHFIGSILGNTGYKRNRESEFSTKDGSKEMLMSEIDNAISAVTFALNKISDTELQKIYPQDFLGKEVSTSYFLIHLIAHLDYHLGQINYLRRIMVKS